jgi:thiamine pyrophosphokinase
LRAIIFANGVLNEPDSARNNIRPDDLVIAADGGLHFCDQLGIVPDVLIGDFDSLTPEKLESLAGSEVEIIRYPTKKDFTDLEAALQQACERDAQNIVVYSALGARWDQTLSNILLPAAKFFDGKHITIMDGTDEIQLIDSRKRKTRVEINGRPGDTLSLIPVGGDATGITTENLEYPLISENLSFGATRGVSNVMLADKACISLEAGLLVCVVTHQPS